MERMQSAFMDGMKSPFHDCYRFEKFLKESLVKMKGAAS
jgi:hypothetical protein